MATAKRNDARLRKDPASEVRGSRAAADDSRTGSDGTATTVEERRKMLRNEFMQEALPTVPPIEGYHLCWLSTTNSYDPIHKRMRLGYEPVRVSEIPGGYESLKMTSGEFEGCVACNEMVLFKLPLDVYQMLMEEFHHNQPLEQEEALKSNLVRGDKDSDGRLLGQASDDFEKTLVRRAPVGEFAG